MAEVYIGDKPTLAAGSLASGDSVVVIDVSAADVRLVLWSGFSALFDAAGSASAAQAAAIAASQPLDADLTAIAALTSAANKLPYATGSGAWALTDFTAFARTILDDADASAVQATLGLVIGTNVQAYDAELAALAGLTSAANKIPYFTGSGTASLLTLDTDGTLAANSDTTLASQKAVKTYVDTAVTGLLDFKGATDASSNPNYPSASKGDAYVVSVAGKVGGASGVSVDVGDVYLATADNAGGTQASVGTSWTVLEHNLVGALLAANNLSDLASASTARTNLGLGTAAVRNTGTSGDAVPLLNAANTFVTGQIFVGTTIFRQDGGTPGTDELQISHTGTLTAIQSKNGAIRVVYGDSESVLEVTDSDATTVRAGFGTKGVFARGAVFGNYNASHITYDQTTLHSGITVFPMSVRGAADTYYGWNSTSGDSNGSSTDTAITRATAQVVRVTNGSTDIGKLLTASLVEANTAGSGSPNVLTATESRTVLTNEGATAENYHTLPTAAAGLDFTFVCQDSDGIRIVANTGDTIRDVGTVSAGAGYIRSSTVGSVIRLVAINATEWIVCAKQGTWTIDS